MSRFIHPQQQEQITSWGNEVRSGPPSENPSGKRSKSSSEEEEAGQDSSSPGSRSTQSACYGFEEEMEMENVGVINLLNLHKLFTTSGGRTDTAPGVKPKRGLWYRIELQARFRETPLDVFKEYCAFKKKEFYLKCTEDRKFYGEKGLRLGLIPAREISAGIKKFYTELWPSEKKYHKYPDADDERVKLIMECALFRMALSVLSKPGFLKDEFDVPNPAGRENLVDDDIGDTEELAYTDEPMEDGF